MAKANRKFKDSVFTMYFNDPEKLIDLYNSIAGTNLPKDTPIEINTLDDALFKNRVNDISFVINGELIVLVEHQSTLNENMPVRLLMYAARVYEKILGSENIYRSSLIKLPAPKFVVLYNGLEPCDDHVVMSLSDAFAIQEPNPMLDLKVDFRNINHGKSAELMKKCQSLNEYSTFVFYVRENQKNGMPLAESIKLAIKQAVQNDIMKDFLDEHGSEVENMLFEEWEWDKYARIQREEGVQEGRREGRQEGLQEGLQEGKSSIIRTLSESFDPETISKMVKLPLATIQQILASPQ